MRVLVVSDLHLGSPGRLQGADRRLGELLSSRDWDRVVFLGDVFDLWLASYEEIARVHGYLLATIGLLGCEVVYVPGNHDAAFRGLSRLNNMVVKSEPYVFLDGGKTIALLHGDGFDPIQKLGPLARILSALGACADRLAQAFAGPGVSVQRTVRNSLSGSGKAKEYSEAVAVGAVSTVDVDLVIAGHTHFPMGPEEIGDTLYVNSGDFGPEHETWVEIVDGEVKVSWQEE